MRCRHLIWPRCLASLSVIVPDVLQGNEKLKIPVMSEFDPPSSLVPDDFVYTWEQRAAAGSMGEAFVESQKLNARKGDLGEAGRRLNAVVTTRDQGAPGLLHLKYFSVRDTEYKGLGLFAKETIRYTSNGSEKGIQAFGELISRHEATRREVAYMREGAVGFTGQCVIDPISNTPLFIDQWAQGSLFRFINHSSTAHAQAQAQCSCSASPFLFLTLLCCGAALCSVATRTSPCGRWSTDNTRWPIRSETSKVTHAAEESSGGSREWSGGLTLLACVSVSLLRIQPMRRSRSTMRCNPRAHHAAR